MYLSSYSLYVLDMVLISKELSHPSHLKYTSIDLREVDSKGGS